MDPSFDGKAGTGFKRVFFHIGYFHMVDAFTAVVLAKSEDETNDTRTGRGKK
jgi:hypothetical protein